MKLKTLVESLRDITTENVLYHGTTLEHLFGILDSGYLKGVFYTSKATEKDRELNYAKEIATARKSSITKINFAKDDSSKKAIKKSLSENIGCVMIHLYKDRVTSGVRGAKVKPIAEIPKRAMQEIKDFFEKLGIEYKKEYLDTLLNYYRYYAKTKKYANNKIGDSLANDIATMFHIDKEKFDINDVLYSLRDFDKFLIDREGEERFILSSNRVEGIPVDPRFMKIEFVENPIEEAKDIIDNALYYNIKFFGASNSKKDIKREMLEIINKNQEIFIKNKYYNDLIKWLQ